MIKEIITNVMSGILVQLPAYILAIWAAKTIMKKAPEWLKQHHENQIKEIAMQKAVMMHNV